MAMHAVARLLRRPAILWMAFPLFVASVVPVLVLAEGGTPVYALWTGDAAEPVRSAAWRIVVMLPAAFGFAVTLPRLELQHALFSWVLPSVRRRLLLGTLVIAVPFAGVAALPVGRIGPLPVGLAAFAVALFWFTVASAAVDVAFPRVVRWLGLLALILAAVRPGAFSRLVEAWPWAAAVIALAAGWSLLAVQFSRRSSRVRHFRWSSAATGATALYWAQRSGVVRNWSRSLATERVGPWLRGVAYEGSAGGPVPFPWRHLLMAAFVVVWSHVTNLPGQILILGGILLSQGRLQLASTLLYPLSRTRRAHLAVAGTMIEAAMFTAAVAAIVVAVQAAGVPVLGWFAEEAAPYGWAVVVGVTWAWAPIAQWSVVRWPGAQLLKAFDARFFVPYLVYVVAATVTAHMLTGQAPLALAGWLIGIAVAVQVLHWIAVHRHFARADLA